MDIKNILDEIVDRVVLAENFHDDFHPDHHPLYEPLGKKRKFSNQDRLVKKRKYSQKALFNKKKAFKRVKKMFPTLNNWEMQNIMGELYCFVHQDGHHVQFFQNGDMASFCIASNVL